MRLADFVSTNREQILIEWESFARTCVPASMTMDVKALRDHASEMLGDMAADLRNFRGESEGSEEPKGHTGDANELGRTAAEEHGEERAQSGLETVQVVAEYRALRASVLRLWGQERGELNAADVEDLIRFNEALDQYLAESIGEFTGGVENAKDTFLAILGHDLRNPLGAIIASATFMSETGEMDRELTLQITASATRATQLVGDLLDFTRSRLGGGIPIHRTEGDLRRIVCRVVGEIMAVHPDGNVHVENGEDQIGHWDGGRIFQAFANLVGNAVGHGEPGGPVRVEFDGGEEEVAVIIHNRGTPISADRLDGIFSPMKPSTAPQQPWAHVPTGNLGLGLYIAERIVHAHGGRIDVASAEADGTTFTVHLPRSP
jgi:signal transduction histidine kinase